MLCKRAFAAGRHIAPARHATPGSRQSRSQAAEPLLRKELLDLVCGVAVEVDPLLFLAAIVQDQQVRVVVVDPFHFELFPVLPLLVFLEELPHLDVGRVVQPSARAALELALGPALTRQGW